MKENGIGRPSTRAAIIETLFRRRYIYRERKNILATQAGIDLIATIQEELLKSAKLTGLWENKLRRIERGEYSAAHAVKNHHDCRQPEKAACATHHQARTNRMPGMRPRTHNARTNSIRLQQLRERLRFPPALRHMPGRRHSGQSKTSHNQVQALCPMMQWIAVGIIIACAVLYFVCRFLRRDKNTCSDCPVSSFCT